MTGSRVVKLYRKGMGSPARRAVLARKPRYPAGRRAAIQDILARRPWNTKAVRDVSSAGDIPDILA